MQIKTLSYTFFTFIAFYFTLIVWPWAQLMEGLDFIVSSINFLLVLKWYNSYLLILTF